MTVYFIKSKKFFCLTQYGYKTLQMLSLRKDSDAVVEDIDVKKRLFAELEDIDKATKLGLNYPMGPFELMDYTGLDINYFVMNGFYHNLQKELKWDPPLSIKNLVKAGMLGKKTGFGWYDYKKQGRIPELFCRILKV